MNKLHAITLFLLSSQINAAQPQAEPLRICLGALAQGFLTAAAITVFPHITNIINNEPDVMCSMRGSIALNLLLAPFGVSRILHTQEERLRMAGKKYETRWWYGEWADPRFFENSGEPPRAQQASPERFNYWVGFAAAAVVSLSLHTYIYRKLLQVEHKK